MTVVAPAPRGVVGLDGARRAQAGVDLGDARQKAGGRSHLHGQVAAIAHDRAVVTELAVAVEPPAPYGRVRLERAGMEAAGRQGLHARQRVDPIDHHVHWVRSLEMRVTEGPVAELPRGVVAPAHHARIASQRTGLLIAGDDRYDLVTGRARGSRGQCQQCGEHRRRAECLPGPYAQIAHQNLPQLMPWRPRGACVRADTPPMLRHRGTRGDPPADIAEASTHRLGVSSPRRRHRPGRVPPPPAFATAPPSAMPRRFLSSMNGRDAIELLVDAGAGAARG